MMVGIDFGTCFSSAAIMSGSIPVTNFIKDTSGTGTPSTFMYLEKNNKELFGEECFTADTVGSRNDIIRYMKRTVRENPDNLQVKVTSGGKDYTICEVIEKYLTYLVGEIRMAAVNSGEFQNTDIDMLTITAPVGIASGQMMASEYNKLLQDTMSKITGLDPEYINIIHEPVAAAIYYLYSEDLRHRYEGIQTVLVFDLGGGTLDVTVMEHDPRTLTYEIKSRQGDLNLGGNDWDGVLADLVLKKVGIDRIEDPQEHDAFRTEITKLKIALSAPGTDNSTIMFMNEGDDVFTRITRDEFENASISLLNRAMDVTRKAMENVNSKASKIDKIVLVGGSCNMPQIRRRIIDEFPELGEDGVSLFDPSKAIAKGAAIYTKMTANMNGSCVGPKIIDCASLTYGFDSNRGGDMPMIYNMIFKGTPFGDSDFITVKAETSFIPHDDHQNRVSFRIYESEGKRGEGDDGNWMDYGNDETYNGMEVVVQVPPQYLGKARGFRMWPILSLDSNGILELTIVDRAGNKLAYGSSTKKGDSI